MANLITNASPQAIALGTQDLSGRVEPRPGESLPQHLAKIYLFASKGDGQPHLLAGADRDATYGSATFDPKSKFFTHTTLYSNLINAEGNAAMYQRLIPADAGPNANFTLWLDVLETTVDVWQRNADGSLFLDGTGSPVSTATVTGYKVKWVVTSETTMTDLNTNFGALASGVGDQTDAVTSAQSTRYPIFSFKAFSQGSAYNSSGIRISVPTLLNQDTMPSKLMQEEKVYPYNISVMNKPSPTVSAKFVSSRFGDNSAMFVTKPDVLDPNTDGEVYLSKLFPSLWANTTDANYPLLYPDFGELHIYQTNIDTLVSMFHTAEVPYIEPWSDFTAAPEDMHLFNFVSGTSSTGAPYTTFQWATDANAVTLNEYTTVFAKNGSDGTMDLATLDAMVAAEMDRYADANDSVQDVAKNVESIIWDSGFGLDTKKALTQFISVRKDTFVALGVYASGQPEMSASEEYSTALSLRTRLQNYPESMYYGTPVARGMVVGRSGRLRNSLYKDLLPMTAEIAIKSARYMGAGNGRWKSGKSFDHGNNAVIENMTDINISWVPVSARALNWDAGLNFVIAYDMSSYRFPALKTVYTDDTSVLNSYFVAMAICYINKVTQAAWRFYTGSTTLTNAQLVDKVNEFVIEKTKDRFDGQFVVVPQTTITESDAQRGYSWTLPVSIYANNMKTVMTTSVQAYRMSDLGG